MPFKFHHSLLVIHIASGSVVLLSGLVQSLLEKGTKFHRVTGRLYLWSISSLLLSGAMLSRNEITLLGFFGYYYAISGYRYAYLKQRPPQLLDQLIILGGLSISGAMLLRAFYLYSCGQKTFSVILFCFGSLFLANLIPDFKAQVLGKPVKKNAYGALKWLFEHYGRMYISYIMALTAFAVINDLFRGALLNWFLPSVIGTTALQLANKFYKKKFRAELSDSKKEEQEAS